MAIRYLNGNIASGGDGSTPELAFKTWAALITAHPTLTGDTVRVVIGSHLRENIDITSQNTITIESYDDGSSGGMPIFDGSDIISSWADEGGGRWSIAATTTHGVWVNDVELVAVSTEIQLADNRMWHDVGNSKLVIQPTTNPNTAVTEVTLREPIRFTTSHTITLDGIHVTKSYNSGIILFSGATDCRILNCKSTKCGSWRSVNNAGATIRGTSTASLSTGFVMENFQSDDHQNGILETYFLDSARIENVSGEGCGMGLELWGFVHNSTFNNFKIRNINNRYIDTGVNAHGNFIWLTQDSQLIGETGSIYNNKFTGFDCIGEDIAIGVDLDAGIQNTFGSSTFITNRNNATHPNTYVHDDKNATVTWTAAAGTLTITWTGHGYINGNNDYIYIHSAVTSNLADGLYQIASVVNVNTITVTSGATAEPTSALVTTCHENDFQSNIIYIDDVTSNQYAFREDANAASLLNDNFIHSTQATTIRALIAGTAYRSTNPTAATYASTFGGSTVLDPLVTDPNSDVTLLASSPCVAATSRWWTGAAPSGSDGEPFSDFDTDIGGSQSTFSPFHPKNL